MIRSAEARLGVIESLGSARMGVERTWNRLGQPRTYIKLGMAAGGGLVGAYLLRRLLSRKPAPTELRPAVSRGASPLSQLMVQALTLLVFPWLRNRLLGGSWNESLKRMQPAHLFFRWLGLEK